MKIVKGVDCLVKDVVLKSSEFVLLKRNIEASDGDSTPPEVKKFILPLIELRVLKIDKLPFTT